MIKLENVQKSFGADVVLERVSFQVSPGEIVCLHGPSGAGKTTILDVIAGVESVSSGTVSIGSNRIGYAFQDDRLVPWISVSQNLELCLRSVMSLTEAKHTASEWLDRFGLSDYREKLCSELSGGMKRRLNIARSLSNAPELLLLDEPFVFQDKSYREQMLGLFEALNRENGTAIVLVEHQPEVAEQLGARHLSIEGKPVVIDG